MVTRQSLFLHGGPGLSAAIERLWFGEQLPVCWWDQPRVVDVRRPAFSALIDAAHSRLRDLSDRLGEPLDIIAHSFGGCIAHAVVQRDPERVRGLTLLACPHEAIPPLIRLGQHLLKMDHCAGLADALTRYEAHPDTRSFEALIDAIAGHPEFPGVYFAPGSTAARERFMALLPAVQYFDRSTYFAVMNEFLQGWRLARLPEFVGEVRLIVGRYDPLMSCEESIAGWRKVFPRAQACIVDTGHYVHLEARPAIWDFPGT